MFGQIAGALGSLGSVISNVGNSSWLQGLGNIGSTAGAFGSLFGTSGQNGPRILSDYDFNRQQNRLNQAMPGEISRQSQFLRGIAPAESEAYNYQQDATFGEDTRRQDERFNELFYSKGVSPWEVVGSPAASGGGGGSTPSSQSDPTASLNFVTELMKMETQQNVASINAEAAVKSSAIGAGLSSGATLGAAQMSKDVGMERNEIERLRVGIERQKLGAQVQRWDEMTQYERASTYNTLISEALKAAPKYKVYDAIGNSIEGIPDNQVGQIASAMQDANWDYLEQRFPRVWQEMGNQKTIDSMASAMGVQTWAQEEIAKTGKGAIEGAGEFTNKHFGSASKTGKSVGSFMKGIGNWIGN